MFKPQPDQHYEMPVMCLVSFVSILLARETQRRDMAFDAAVSVDG
jgi:hypothetical protein